MRYAKIEKNKIVYADNNRIKGNGIVCLNPKEKDFYKCGFYRLPEIEVPESTDKIYYCVNYLIENNTIIAQLESQEINTQNMEV